MASPRVVVVGAGIVGASIAWHLARRGAAVTLLDRGPPGGGVTVRAFGWINGVHDGGEAGAALRRIAMAEYERLDAELGGALRIDRAGSLRWDADPGETERFVRRHAAEGAPVRLAGRDEIAALEPALREPPECAALTADGALDPGRAAAVLAVAARDAGAGIAAARVTALRAPNGRVTGVETGVETGAAVVPCDVVVLAAGTGTSALARDVGAEVPVAASPALLLRLAAPGCRLAHVLSGPDFEVRPAGAGALVAAEDVSPAATDAEAEAVARRAQAGIAAGLRRAEAATLTAWQVGQRPMPADGEPIVGPLGAVRNLYVAVMHAGVTLAAAVGRLAAEEILGGAEAAPLARCRPARFGGSPD